MTSETIDSMLIGLVGYKMSYGDLKQGFVRINLNKKDMDSFKKYIDSPEYTSPLKFTPTKKGRYRGIMNGVFILIVPTQSPESTVAVNINVDRLIS